MGERSHSARACSSGREYRNAHSKDTYTRQLSTLLMEH